jgi:hypothetical protein
MKYGTYFHTQSFVGHINAACLALEHPVPAGSGFSTKSLFGKPLLTSLPGLPDTDYDLPECWYLFTNRHGRTF